MKQLVTLLSNHTETCNKRFISLQERVIECLSSENDGVPPTVDRLGRLHAGGDEYNDINGEVYIKGQYIPMPEELSDECFFGYPSFKKDYKTRIQICSTIIEDMKNLNNSDLDGIEISFGKIFKRSNIDTCYVYIKACTKGYFNIVVDYLNELVKLLKKKLKQIQLKKKKALLQRVRL